MTPPALAPYYRNHELLVAIGHEIYSHRRAQGLTQSELGRRAGFGGSTPVSNVESGRHAIGVDNFVRICDALDLPAWAVLKAAMEEVALGNEDLERRKAEQQR